MWTVALSYGFLAAVLVEAPAFQAIGRSWPGFWIFFLRVMVVTLPLTVLFTKLNWPITGVWAAIVAGNVVASVVGYMWITRALKKAHAPEGLTKT